MLVREPSATDVPAEGQGMEMEVCHLGYTLEKAALVPSCFVPPMTPPGRTPLLIPTLCLSSTLPLSLPHTSQYLWLFTLSL